MRRLSLIAFGLFALAGVVQLNDPDPLVWILAYGVAAATALAASFGLTSVPITGALALLYALASWWCFPTGANDASLGVTEFGMSSLGVEEVPESLGLGICAAWMVFLLASRRRGRAAAAGGLALVGWFAAGCVATEPIPAGTRPAETVPAGTIAVGTISARTAPETVAVPESVERRLVPRSRVATDLENPRGMLARDGGALLVSVAGTGDPKGPPTGALLLLEDGDGDGTFDERRVLLDGQLSRNIIDIVRRDEVFGMAAIAEGDGATLVSLAYFGGPSTIYRVQGDDVVEWSRVYGNINDLDYDPTRKQWVGVSSSSDEVVRLRPGRGSERILKLPPLEGGQDAVPGYLRHDPQTDDLLVTLFSGSTEGEEGGAGIELLPRAGGIVRVDPETGEMRWIVTGLTAPTDLEIGPDGRLYVLEFCSRFEDPVVRRSDMWKTPGHGGFRRFSGRLLAIERDSGEVTLLAEGLDGPTNLALHGRDLYIAQGMGTPGRPIPGPDGTVALTGFIDKLRLPGGRAR